MSKPRLTIAGCVCVCVCVHVCVCVSPLCQQESGSVRQDMTGGALGR